MSKMNQLSIEEQENAYEQYIEAERQALRDEGKEEYRLEMIQVIKTELLWKTQDEGFIGGLEWVLDKLNGVDRI